MTLDRLKGIYSVDRETGLVRAAAGTRLHEMNALLDIHGLAFENLGDINVQSLAGAISTATHGSGAAFGNLATFVESLELVTADGEVREVSGDDLRAARVSVGALGVVTAYTLRTVPAFRLRERRDRVPLDRILAELDDRVARNDHFEFFVFPHAQKVLTKELNRTSEPVSAHNERLSYLQEVVVENRVLDLVSRMGRRRDPPPQPGGHRAGGHSGPRRREPSDLLDPPRGAVHGDGVGVPAGGVRRCPARHPAPHRDPRLRRELPAGGPVRRSGH
jgi:L-gulonolactone oxidase